MISIRNNKGFTLIELIAVMAIMGIWSSLLIKKINNVDRVAKEAVILAVASDLNSREMGLWAKAMMNGYESDIQSVWINKEYLISDTITWISITPTGGVVDVNGTHVNLTRTPSTAFQAARWGPGSA